MALRTDVMLDNQQDLYRRIDILERLVKVSLALNSTLQTQTLLEYVVDAATEITDSEAASILLAHRSTGELHFSAASGAVAHALIGMGVPLEGSIAGTVLAQNRAVIVEDVTADQRHYHRIGEQSGFKVRSILGVPMRMRDAVAGVLEVLNKRSGPYSPDDVQHLTILASQAAIAIETAELIRSLEEAYENLNRLNKLKTDFISIASHELRTPLGLIMGYAALLKDDAQGSAQEYADVLLASAKKMSALVDGMTSLRYVQLDDSELALAEVDVADILEMAYQDTCHMADEKNQRFVLKPPDAPLRVYADLPKAVMALSSVLENAIKFTSCGGLIVLSAEQRGQEAWIIVRDNGCGIPPEDLERVFELFYQVEDPLTRRHDGLGLGLSIARAVVGRHGGRIWADSAGSGRGSRFTVALPLVNNHHHG